MNLRRLCTSVMPLAVLALASLRAQAPPDPEHPVMSVFSPFSGIVDQMLQGRPPSVSPFICPIFNYYSETGSLHILEQNLPTSKFAFRVTLPTGNAAPPCTVWTFLVDFEMKAAAASRDTIQFFLREVAAPYSQIYTTYYLAKGGENLGGFELDPPPPTVPPTLGRPIISYPRRDMYIGFWVRGNSTNTVKLKFRKPAQYTNPVRSVAFTTNSSWVSASSVVGQSVDWVAGARICCHYFPPVELSLISGSADEDAVRLSWKTETETNNYQFEILRSTSIEGPWESRGFVAGGGSTTSPRFYEYVDQLASGPRDMNEAPVLFYRLIQTDFDGTAHDGPVIRVLLVPAEDLRVRLAPVFPNPLNLNSGASAVIRYELDRPLPVRLSVIDPLGREISVLTDEMKSAGSYESIWNPGAARGLPTGTYFFRLVAGDAVSSSKLGLIR